MKALLLLFVCYAAEPAADPMAEAQTLFHDGAAKYDSADYEGAIESFTEALTIVRANKGELSIRLRLLYNIGSAHEKQFAIDRDVEHLRRALSLYERYLEYSEHAEDLGDQLDVEARVLRLEKKLRMADQIEANKATTPPPVRELPDSALGYKRPRNIGLGLVVPGVAASVGGAVLIALGSRYEGNAQSQVDELETPRGSPEDHPAWSEGEDFVSVERRKGVGLMAGGAVVATVGLVGVGVGTYYLVKSRNLRLQVTPSVSPTQAGLVIGGRF